jgi:SAM-dependent methyltransferase
MKMEAMETEINSETELINSSVVGESTNNVPTYFTLNVPVKKDPSRKAKMQRRARALEKIARGEKRGPSQPKNKATKDGSGGAWSDSFWQLVGSEEESKKRRKESETGAEDGIVTDRTWALVAWNEMRAEAAKRLLEAEGPNPTLPETEIGEFHLVILSSFSNLTFLGAERLEEGAQEQWEVFYQRNQDRFFKSRRYLQLEFPELLPPNPTPDLTQRKFPPPVVARFGASAPTSALPFYSSTPFPSSTSESSSSSFATPTCSEEIAVLSEVERRNVLEVGCGVGNTLFPILEINPHNFFYAFDFSASAIEIVKAHPLYTETSRCKAFVFDLTSHSLPTQEQEPGFPSDGSIDIVLMIFVLSAVSPEKMKTALNNVFRVMKPGGILLFRDYGLYDMTQMRFVSKGGRKLGENFYTRGDGTRTYFFSKEVAEELFTSSGFNTLHLEYDTRELRNRKRKISMYRVWLVGKFQKRLIDSNEQTRS